MSSVRNPKYIFKENFTAFSKDVFTGLLHCILNFWYTDCMVKLNSLWCAKLRTTFKLFQQFLSKTYVCHCNLFLCILYNNTFSPVNFKLILNSIGGNCDPLFSQKSFDHTHVGGFLSRGFFGMGVLSRRFLPGGLCPRTVGKREMAKNIPNRKECKLF